MATIAQYLRALPGHTRDGFAALRDIIVWGSVYPRSVDLATLRAMRKRP